MIGVDDLSKDELIEKKYVIEHLRDGDYSKRKGKNRT